VVTAATTAPAFAASPCETLYSYRLNWLNAASNYVHAAGAPNQASATIASTNGGPTIYASFATQFFGAGVGDGNINDAANGESRNLSVPSGTAGSNATRDPAITNLGGIGGTNGTARGVRLQEASPAGYANRQELTVTFRSGSATGPVINVRGLSFYIVDIDAITTSPYSDRVVLSPTVAPANQTRDSAIVGDGTYVAESSNAVGPWRNSTANNNQPENQSGARVQVNYPSTTAAQFSSFKVTYWTNTGTGQYHRIYLSDFVFNSTACL
jgi:hypothetical protein